MSMSKADSLLYRLWGLVSSSPTLNREVPESLTIDLDEYFCQLAWISGQSISPCAQATERASVGEGDISSQATVNEEEVTDD